MTKVIMDIHEDGSIFFDCENHSDDYDVCTIVSTLCNVLVVASNRANFEPTEYKPGHVRIYIPKAEYPLIETFRAVEDTLKEVQKQNPKYVKIY